MNEIGPTTRTLPRKVGIIVAGMHRAGTSATARVVNLLGADITKDLMPGEPSINERGFWESEVIAGIHDRLLHGLGSAWDDPMPLPDRWLETEAARAAQYRLAGEIQKDFAESRVFVTKDPRVSRFLPLWFSMFEQLSIEPLVVIPFRNPLEVANSLDKRDHFPLGKSLLLFVRSYLDIELASRGRPRLFVHYQELIENQGALAAPLRQALGELWPPQRPDAATLIDGYLSAALRRNRSSRDDLAAAPNIPQTVIDVYDQMIAASKTGDDARLCRSFDDVRANVTEATKLFDGLVLAERERYREIRGPISQLNATLEARSAEADALKAKLAEARVRVAELDAAVRTAQAKLAARMSDIAKMRQSASWRATAPFRLAKRWAARLVGQGRSDVASSGTPR